MTEPSKTLVHDILSDEYLELIKSTITKFKMGLEIWWTAAAGVMQIPIQNPNTGETLGMSSPQVVVQIIMFTKGYALGPENNVNTVGITNPVPIVADLEKVIIKGIEHLNAQRAAQMNGTGNKR